MEPRHIAEIIPEVMAEIEAMRERVQPEDIDAIPMPEDPEC